jgi:hypothetical protein
MTWGWGQGGEMTQALYAHMNDKTIKKQKQMTCNSDCHSYSSFPAGFKSKSVRIGSLHLISPTEFNIKSRPKACSDYMRTLKSKMEQAN